MKYLLIAIITFENQVTNQIVTQICSPTSPTSLGIEIGLFSLSLIQGTHKNLQEGAKVKDIISMSATPFYELKLKEDKGNWLTDKMPKMPNALQL